MKSKKEQSKIKLLEPSTPESSVTASSSSSISSVPSTSNPSPVGATNCCIGDGSYYTLGDFEQDRVERDTVDMNKWESYLSPDEFAKHFGGLSKAEFYDQPKWVRDKQKRK